MIVKHRLIGNLESTIKKKRSSPVLNTIYSIFIFPSISVGGVSYFKV